MRALPVQLVCLWVSSPDHHFGLVGQEEAMLLTADMIQSHDACHPQHVLSAGGLHCTYWQITWCCEHLIITHTGARQGKPEHSTLNYFGVIA